MDEYHGSNSNSNHVYLGTKVPQGIKVPHQGASYCANSGSCAHHDFAVVWYEKVVANDASAGLHTQGTINQELHCVLD